MISIKMSATKWLASACRDSVRLVYGPAKLRQECPVRSQAVVFSSRQHFAAVKEAAPAYIARIALPANQLTKGGLCGPQPWRDAPVIS
ncbi:hypothetical protein [Nonomuraea aridisoli]|uniref:Uncharacterized protein n=1 Tax=Nonomuraea aridisoli TaxID=2070368 RepID=A0A2W2EIL0_9ACTN|nr:hypothetical protein [Nonomuraea aridisoli]PZG16749.1 hypothetical protein C1J01_20150 [Nonomuraea aridisoli]